MLTMLSGETGSENPLIISSTVPVCSLSIISSSIAVCRSAGEGSNEVFAVKVDDITGCDSEDEFSCRHRRSKTLSASYGSFRPFFVSFQRASRCR